MKSVSMGSFQYKNRVSGESFAYLWVFSKQFSIKIVKYEDGMLILGQNDIFCGHNVVNFSVWFLQLTVFKYLVASHVTEQG